MVTATGALGVIKWVLTKNKNIYIKNKKYKNKTKARLSTVFSNNGNKNQKLRVLEFQHLINLGGAMV